MTLRHTKYFYGSLLAAFGLVVGCTGDDTSSASSDSASSSTSDTNPTTTATSATSTATSSPTTDASGSNSASSSSGSMTDSDATTDATTGETDTTAGTDTSTTTTTGPITNSGSSSGSTDGGCMDDIDCPDGESCIEGLCVPPPECVEDKDCADLQYCDAGTCQDLCQPGDDMMMGMVEDSFLWVANTSQGSISKVDTQMLVELARYRSGPGGGSESPSRTAVSVDGRFVVVNNRGTGRVTMIAANPDDCTDKDNSNTIETSQNPNDLLAWQADECVLWSTQLPSKANDNGAGPRAVTWTLGTWNYDSCAYEDPKVWVGYRPANSVAHMAQLNGLTGVIEETVEINPWTTGNSSWGPYGAALDKDANVWFTGLRGDLYKIDTQNNNTLATITSPGNSQFYGMTVDEKGRTWTAGCSGPVYRYDPMDQSWTAVNGTGNNCLRGIGADREGAIWVASNGQCGVYQIDADDATVIKFHSLNPCSTPVGISIDEEGYVFVVDQGQGAWKIDPLNTDDKQFLPITGNHYTYSDMTGGQLKGALPQ